MFAKSPNISKNIPEHLDHVVWHLAMEEAEVSSISDFIYWEDTMALMWDVDPSNKSRPNYCVFGIR